MQPQRRPICSRRTPFGLGRQVASRRGQRLRRASSLGQRRPDRLAKRIAAAWIASGSTSSIRSPISAFGRKDQRFALERRVERVGAQRPRIAAMTGAGRRLRRALRRSARETSVPEAPRTGRTGRDRSPPAAPARPAAVRHRAIAGAEKSRLIDSSGGSSTPSKRDAGRRLVEQDHRSSPSSAPLSAPISAVCSGRTIGCFSDWPGVSGTD